MDMMTLDGQEEESSQRIAGMPPARTSKSCLGEQRSSSTSRSRRPRRQNAFLLQRSQHHRQQFLWFLVIVLLWLSGAVDARGRPRCLYNILGVTKKCSASELKKAYRRAALQAHPDKGGDEETFKELSQAYQVLSDPEQRLRYDRFGHSGVGMGPTPTPGGGGARSSYPPGGGGRSQQFSFQTGGNNNAGAGAPDFGRFFQEYAQAAAANGGGGGGRAQFGGPGGGGFSFGLGGNGNGASSSSSSFGLEDWIRRMMMGGGGGGPGTSSTTSRRRPSPPTPLKPVTRPLKCTLADLFVGKTKVVTLQIQNPRTGAVDEQRYTIQLKPGWKAGTKIKFPQRGRHVPPITFVIQEAKHATLERRDNDLVYRHKVPRNRNNNNANKKYSHSKRKLRKNSIISDRDATKDKPLRLSITLPDGHVWERTVPADRVARLVKPGQSLTVPDFGFPIKNTTERGNLIIEFY